jgi:hypothetical protein
VSVTFAIATSEKQPGEARLRSCIVFDDEHPSCARLAYGLLPVLRATSAPARARVAECGWVDP